MVVLQTLMYGMETFWDGQVKMRKTLQELERKVARWGYRLARGKENGKLAKEVKEKMEEPGGVYKGGIIGRLLRGLKENKLEEERWEVESERMGKIIW
ncbi:hypothetical protein C7212DRAFT_304360, partial [Tuber magnatum]